MKLKYDADVKLRLEELIGFIKERSGDQTHENNGDVIADFIDRFLLVELKRLDNNPETVIVDLEIPNEVFTDPLTKMKDAMLKPFDDFLAGHGVIVPQSKFQSGKTPIKFQPGPGEDPDKNADEKTSQPAHSGTSVPSGTSRNGNGHKKDKKRSLNGSERDYIKSEFLKLNGEFEDSSKSCTAMLTFLNNNNPGDPLGTFQITGFVSTLHANIARGWLQVGDMDSYIKFMQGKKNTSLWRRFNSTKMQQSRKNQAPASASPSTSASPNMKQGSKFSRKTV